MHKKVGIMTFHSAHNCGSMLQSYALQAVLSSRYGVDAEIIDYVNKGSRNIYGFFDLRAKRSAIEHNINSIRYPGAINTSRKAFIDFSNKYLKKSNEKYFSHKDLNKAVDKYDIFIAGGDQIWNIKCADADDAYFLDFVHDKIKASYSPSLGSNSINKVSNNPQKYAEYLNDFDFLSVREPNGKRWLQELVDKDISIIADPTMLLTANEWDEAFNLPNLNEPYIFNYAIFHTRPETNLAIQRLSEKAGMPVYVMDIKSWNIYHLDKYGIKCYKDNGPFAFLTLMRNASMVLAQSFHGTLFAALFHRQFWSYKGPQIINKDDDRVVSFLSKLGLSDRFQTIDDLPEMDFNKKIDFDCTDKMMEKMRTEAFLYLDNIINGINRG